MFEVNPGSMRLSAVKARLLAREGKYREAREILNHFDNPGADIQKLNITCLEKGSLDDKVMENVTTGLKKTIDMYTFDELRELSDSGMEGRCKYSRELLLSLFDRVLSMPTGHKFQAHKFYVVKARYLWMEGRAEEASQVISGQPNSIWTGRGNCTHTRVNSIRNLTEISAR